MGNPNDPLGILQSGGDDPLGILKKKDGGSASTSGAKPSSPKSINDLKGVEAPSYYKEQKQTFEKVQTPEVDDDPVGNVVRKTAVRKQEIKQQHAGSDATYVAGNYKGISTEIDQLNKEERAASNYRFETTADAKGVLQKFVPNIDELPDDAIASLDVKDNLTAQRAKEQVLDQRNINKILSSSSTFESAAVQFGALKNPLIAKQIEAQGGELFASKSQKGALVADFLQQPAAKEWARQSQENMNAFKAAQNNFISNYPDLATSQLASILSKEREKRGLNNGLLNSVSNEEMDAIVADMVAKGDLSQQQRVVYEKLLRPQTKGLRNPYQTPGLFENLPKATKESIKGMARSVEEGIDMITPGDFVDEAVATQQDIEKDYTHVDFKPKGLWHEFSAATATLTPQVLLMGTGIKGLQALNLIKNPAVSGALMEGMQSYGYNVAEARKQFPNEPVKQMAHATLTTAFEMAMSRVFPDEKVVEGIGKAFKGKTAGVIADFAEGKITSAAAKDLLQSDVQRILTETLPQFIGKTFTNTQKEALEEVVPQVLSDVLTDVFEGKPIEERQLWANAFDTWKQTTLGSGVISGLAANADTPPLMRSMIYDMAQNADVISRQNLDADALGNLDFADGVVKDLDKTELTQRQKEKYLLHSLNEKVLKDKLDNTSDSVLQQPIKEQIKASKEAREKLLITRAEQIAAKEEKQVNENKETQTEIPQVESVPTESVQVEQQQEATPVVESIESTNETTENNQQEVAQQEVPEIQSTEAQEVVQETNLEPQNQIQNERQEERRQEGLLTPDVSNEQGATETVAPAQAAEAPQSTELQGQGEEGEVKKTVLTKRAYEGTIKEQVKQEIEKHGLTRKVENQEEAFNSAKKFVDTVGDDAALEAVRSGQMEGGAFTAVYANLILNTKTEYDLEEAKENPDTQRLYDLAKKYAMLTDELDTKSTKAGQQGAMFNYVYKATDLGFNVDVKIEDYKNQNNGVISEEVEKKFRDLDKELKGIKLKLAEAEKKAKEVEAKADIAAIKEAEARKKNLESKKSYSQKAKETADKVRKLKNKPLTFKDADGNDIPVQLQGITWNDLVEAAAKIIEKTGQIADGIAHIVSELQKAEWYQKLDDRNRNAVIKQIEDYFNEEDTTDGPVKIKHSLIREAVENGAEDIDAVVAYIKNTGEFPNATDREIRDAVTNYGKTINPNKEEIETKIRKIKRIGRIVSGLEDIANKKRPLRSGAQRDKLDAEERAMQKELREAMKELPMDEETESRQLRTAVDAAKQRLRNQIEDLQRQIDTGEKVERSKRALPEDDEMKRLREERDQKKEEFEQIFGENGLSDEQKLQNAIKSVERSIEEYERRIREKDTAPKKKATAPDSDELKNLKIKRDSLKEDYKKMLDDEGVIQQRRLESAKKRAQSRIEDLQRRIKEGDFSKKVTKPVVADTELVKLNAEKLRIQEEYDKEFYKNQLKNRTRNEKIKDAAWEAWGLFRILQATGEFSFALIQGRSLTLSYLLKNPKIVGKAFNRAFQFMKSQDKAENWLRQVKSQEWYPIAKEAKLAITEPNAELMAREEVFFSGWANFLWNTVLGNVVSMGNPKGRELWSKLNPFNALERASVGYLDTLRVERFLEGLEVLEMKKSMGEEVTKKDTKDVADYVNTFTGRASLGPFEQNARMLTKIFFSPRNWASTLKTTPPYGFIYFSRLSPTARKMALADFSRSVGLTLGLMSIALAYYNNDDEDKTGVELDPRSSDFGKLKIGNTRVDPWGGKIQQITFLSRMIMGALGEDAYKKNGKLLPLGIPNKTPNMADLTVRMATNKLSPTAGMVYQFMTTRMKKEGGEYKRINTFGDHFNEEYSVFSEAGDKMLPIYYGTVQDIWKENPDALAGILTFYAFFGGGVNVYEDKKEAKGSGQVTWK